MKSGGNKIPTLATSPAVGKNVPTSLKESVQVRLQEIDGVDETVIEGEA